MTAAGIILAAGDGTRMRTKKPKPLHTVAGLALVAHTVQIMRLGGIKEIRVVLSQELAGNPAMREVLAHDIAISIQAESKCQYHAPILLSLPDYLLILEKGQL